MTNKRPYTAVDLFSGLGGFTLAAHWNGIETVCFVEKDEKCRAFLAKAWPGVPQYDDIKTFPAERFKAVDFVFGGPPCQPVSLAGKRRGKADDRYLWNETLAVIETIRPAFCLLENPPGIKTMGLDGILSELEDLLHYAARTFSIPACAVNAPHRRERYWIVANAKARQDNCGRNGDLAETQGRRKGGNPPAWGRGQGGMADMLGKGLEKSTSQPGDYGQKLKTAERGVVCGMADSEGINGRTGAGRKNRQEFSDYSPWADAIWLPCADGKLRRAPNDTFLLASRVYAGLHQQMGEEKEIGLNLHRSILGALGNSVLPQVVYAILQAMIKADSGWE